MTADNEKNRIGYRYLFDSKGCSLSGRDELKVNLVVSEKYEVQVYFGTKPQYKIDSVVGSSKYYLPGTKTPLGRCTIGADANQLPQYGPLFLEIVISTEADTMEVRSGGESNFLLKQAEKRKDEFKNVIDLVAGIIGLRFQRQFVLELVSENVLAWEGQSPFKGFAAPAVEILEPVALNENEIKHLEAMGQKLKTLSCEDAQRFGLIFHWLMRAWHERDILYEFIDLFIPLEAVLSMLSDTKIGIEDKRKARTIRTAIRKHAGEDSKNLLQFFNKLFDGSRPTPEETFVELAETAKFPGWQNDIEAFRKFKRMRNELFHGSSKEVHQKLSVGDNEEVREFSDLVERYVNYFFFRDNKVYRSRWRPEIRAKDARA